VTEQTERIIVLLPAPDKWSFPKEGMDRWVHLTTLVLIRLASKAARPILSPA